MSETISILFLGGAKRVSVARFFKRAAKTMGKKALIYSYEKDKHVPIAAEGEVIPGLSWDDPNIISHLLKIVETKNISIVVPFVDGAIEIASRLSIASTKPLFAPCSAPELCEIMFDKKKAAEYFSKLGFNIPETFNGNFNHTLIAKPRHGSASHGIIHIDEASQLEKLDINEYLIQRRFDNKEEYTIDCYVSLSTGKPLAIVPRKRIEVRDGEVTHTATVIYPEAYDMAKEILEKTSLKGAITIQLLLDKNTNNLYLMEINPRLGGGVVCSILAQADIPLLIVQEAMGIEPNLMCYRPYTEIVRYPQEVAFYN